MVGRQEQLDRLLSLARAGEPAVALVAGEAGIGKTRLVTELVRRAGAEGATCLVGGCLEFGSEVYPLAPVATMLRDLAGRADPTALDQVLGPARQDLARLVPELGAAADAGPAPSARLFEHLLGVAHRLATSNRLLLVVEDLHWADATTRDLFTFLARQLRAPVLLVGTYRTDELYRRHPLHPVLAEIRRALRPLDVALPALTDEELGRLLAELLRREPDEDTVADVHRRTGGNPFFAEELLAAGSDGTGPVPDALRDVVLARAGALSDGEFHLLCVAAAAGRVDDVDVVGAASGVPRDRVDDMLARLESGGLLVAHPDGWRFRHELAREVFEAELRPGVRARAHAALADALLARAPQQAGRISRHLWRAGDQSRALEWSVRAGRAAEQVGAAAEAQEAYERALDVWHQVPDAAERIGMSHPDLLLAAARAAHEARHFDRAISMIEEAITELDADPAVEGTAWVQLSESLFMSLGRSGVQEAVQRALALIPAEPPSAARAYALARQGGLLNHAARYASGEQVSRQALAQARAAGDEAAELYALNTLAVIAGAAGDRDAPKRMREALDRALAAGRPDAIGRGYWNFSHLLLRYGLYDELLATVREGQQVVTDLGISLSYGVGVYLNELEALRDLGRWDELESRAAEVRDLLDERSWRTWQPGFAWSYGLVLLRRGRLSEARPMFAQAERAVFAMEAFNELHNAAVGQLELAVIDQRWDDARATVERALPLLTHDPLAAVRVVAAGAAAEAERVAVGSGDGDTLARRWLAQARAVVPADQELAFGEQLDTWLAQAHAECDRAFGTSDPERWQRVAQAWQRLRQPYDAGYAWLRAGEAVLFGSGPVDSAARERAAGLLGRAHETARQLRAVRVTDQAATLARQARLTLGEPVEPADDTQETAAPFGLTERERQVLAQLAAGRTNGEIGAALFISRKTAGVHVSNILRKLGVANRVQAAAVAHRAGLVSGTGSGD
jgi:DNA-binding CsgD family transcriptional regulator